MKIGCAAGAMPLPLECFDLRRKPQLYYFLLCTTLHHSLLDPRMSHVLCDFTFYIPRVHSTLRPSAPPSTITITTHIIHHSRGVTMSYES
jgi:hypothetical protein